MPRYLFVLPLALLWATPAAPEAYYFRTPGGAPANPVTGGTTDPDKTGNSPAPAPPALSASGMPDGPTTVGDGISVRFLAEGLGQSPVFTQSGSGVPTLVLSQDGVLTGSLTAPGTHVLTVQAAGNGKTASSSMTFETRWYPPALSLAEPTSPLFRGIPFSLQSSATNGASISQWSIGSGIGGSVSPTGLVTAEAPVGQDGDVIVSVVGTDAWGQTGAAERSISFATPTASLVLPARMRGGQTYSVPLTTNLPSPAWSTISATGGSATVSGTTLAVAIPPVSTPSPVSVGVRAASGKASADATASASVVPPLAVAVQPSSTVTAARAAGQLAFNPPTLTGQLGTPSYALRRGGTDVSDTMSAGCPGFSFSRQTGVISGRPTQVDCYGTYAYAITDPGDGTAPPSSVDSSPFLFRTMSNPTFSAQPAATAAVVQGSSVTVTASLAQDGGYVSPLQFWRVTNGTDSGDKMPSWASMNCPTTSASCSVTFSPPTSLAPGSYGPYAVMAGDGTGFYKASGTFSVNVAGAAFYLSLSESNYNVSAGTTFTGRATVNRTSPATSINGAVQWSVVGNDGTPAGVPSWLTKGTSTNDSASGYSLFIAAPPNGTETGVYPRDGGQYRIRAVDTSGFVAYSTPFTVTVYNKVSVVGARPVAAVYGGGPVSFTQLCSTCTTTSVGALWTGTASLPLSIDSRGDSVDVVQYDFGQPVFLSTYWMVSTTKANNTNFWIEYWDGGRWNSLVTARGNYDDAAGFGSGVTARYVRLRLTTFIAYPQTVSAAKMKFGDSNAVFAP